MNRNASTNVCRLAASASDHARPPAHGTSTRRSATSARVAREREPDRERARGVDLGLERRRLLEREEDRVAEALRQQERGDRRDRDRRDDGDAQAADDRRHRERQLDARQDLAPRQAHAARRLEHVGRRARAARRRCSGRGSRACSATSAISTVVVVMPGERDEELEEREARDRVEQRRDDRRSAARAGGSGARAARARTRSRSRSRPRSPSARGAATSAGSSVSPQCSRTQSQQNVWSPVHARAALAEGRDDGAGGRLTAALLASLEAEDAERLAVVADRRAARSACVSSISETAFRTVVVERDAAPSAPSPSTGVELRRRASVRSASRRSARSSPMNCATKSSAGCARIASGVSYCASTPPSRRIAMRSPIVIASSMSCVTKITVFADLAVQPAQLVSAGGSA